MIIHVVQQGETISSIAKIYGKETDRLILENGLINPNNLAVGQTIVIVEAKQVYTVMDGDTLQGIAENNGTSVTQLLRNNPYLLDREYIYPGETIVINYKDEKKANITTNGYVFPFVDLQVLERNLLFLTYLSVYSYSVTSQGDLNDIDDINIINLAKSYGVAPIMVISNERGNGDEDKMIIHNILTNQEVKNNFIENILNVLKRKGYYAVNFNLPYINVEDRESFYDLIMETTKRFHTEGFKVFTTITPTTLELESGLGRGELDYSVLGKNSDGIILLSYDWANPTNIAAELIPFYFIRNLIKHFASILPPEKIMIGHTTIGYMWGMPYVEGVSKGNAISYSNAVLLASQTNSVIQFNSENLSSFYNITNKESFLVIFHDARGLNTYMQTIPEFGLQGLGIWNVMYELPQTFFLINTQFDIINVL